MVGGRANGVAGFFAGAAIGAAAGFTGSWAGALWGGGYRAAATAMGANSVLFGGIIAGESWD